MSRLRIASVPYLNAEPLTRGFERTDYARMVEMSYEPPSRLPELLASERIDVGLIPSIEFQRLPGVELLPFVCIASRQRARSVLLVTRRPMQEIRSVALDANSRTSVALLKIILAHRGIGNVVYGELEPTLPQMLRRHDAALIIGDPALTCDTGGCQVHDLATEWFSITGLPFVFALWGARAEAALPDGLRPFLDSRREGIEQIGTIAQEASARLGLAPASLEEYLRVNLHYDLGPEEVRGMDLFFRQAWEIRLTPGYRPIRYHRSADHIPALAGRAPETR